jgi:hypothetical protein
MPDGRHAFAAEGTFLRGNLHTHSTRSDGAREPAAVCAFYRDAGYDFLCLSDHFLSAYGFPITDTTGERTNRFTTILGAEVHAGKNSQGEIWHILAVGLPADFAPTAPDESGEALAARAKAAGAFVAIAHPQWSSLTAEDGRSMAPHVHAVEVWNTSCALETARPDGTAFLDALLNEGQRHLTVYAADDAHFHVADAGHAAVMVKATENQPEAILAALKAGHTYATTGPLIHAVAVDGDHIVARTSEVAAIALVGRGSRADTVAGTNLTEARLPTAKYAGDWCRLVAMDTAGRTAWTNPIFPA